MDQIIKSLQDHWQQNRTQDLEKFALQPRPAGARIETDYKYVAHGDNEQTLNLYFPESAMPKKLPTIIDIHGGGWMYGDRNLNNNYCLYLASLGYAVMAMSYRLFPKVGIKSMVQDIFSSLHWLEDYRSDEFDLSKVLLTGDSAGGHLAALVMEIQSNEKLQQIYGVKPVNFSFSLVAITCGVVEPDQLKSVKDSLMAQAKDVYHQLFIKEGNIPFNFSEVISDGTKMPEVMVIGGGQDRFISQTELLIKLLKDHNYRFTANLIEFDEGPHLGHVFNVSNWEWPESIRVNQKMIEQFIKE
ncbi:alpha/beta hydrolase [Xylocopilactobacillus apis]|uniref:Esterase n=1 Tax=Xylocopilactobacillus apis TaxID=2932183 RepID=A0AAU9CNL7_9LACO|nr:alpha/beta hydrolase [Xylocopilactobacillus apis]BDR55537.1 esterase [Xylocopilactobacillus apis]